VIARLALAVVLSVALCDGAAGASPKRSVPSVGHAIVIVFENKEYSDVLNSDAAPTFAAMGRRYALLTGYHGVSHPSLPNYLALVSGSTHGIRTDCTECTVKGPNLADLVEASGRTWRAYEQGLPRAGFTGASAGRYVKKHNPFLYFRDVSENHARLQRIVPLPRFTQDERAGTLPDFALVVPDLCNDMHDCSVATGDRWLRSFLRPLLQRPKTDGIAIFVIFDEGSSNAHGGGHVPALVLGPLVRPHSVVATTLDHYDLLRTIEDAWGLPRLGRSATATPITGVWR
jgi:hypothetical protein